ncbi:MAG: Dabb family protein [Dehalococcoidia bacterium]|nr:Dabb family protein [Dehalococcoidia bacterium]
MRRHIYNFNFKDDVSDEQYSEIYSAFEDEFNANPGMIHFSMGKNISESKRPMKFNTIMTMDFEDYKSFRDYEDNDNHQAIKLLLHEAIDGIMGTDYDIGNTPK